MRNLNRDSKDTMREVVEKSRRLETFLRRQIIGQETVIGSFSDCIKYGWCQLSTPNRPRGTLFLLGPTGVGKTESVRAAAEFMYGSPDARLLRLDMSEFSRQAGEEALVNLLGTPGGKSPGRLERFLEENDEGIILYDEIEKAHSDIQNLLLQILEDGNLTDSQGRRADFSNTIILLTSNLGARCLSGQTSPLGFGAAAAETRRRGQQAIQEAKEFFRPELMGRLDETVLFDPLGPEQLAGIADRLLVELEQRAARQGYTLHHTPAAAKVLAGDKVPPYGARELRRTVSRAVEQALADRIAAGTAHPGTVYTADVDADGHIILTEDTLAACV